MMTLHYGLRGEVESKCAKKLETLNPSFSSIKSNLYLLHFLRRLWPIFGTQKMGLNWCDNLAKIAANVWARVLSKILRIQSLRTFHERNPVLFEDTLWVRFCWYGDCRTMGVGMCLYLVLYTRGAALCSELYCNIPINNTPCHSLNRVQDHLLYLDGFSREVKIARRQIGLLGALCVAVIPS